MESQTRITEVLFTLRIPELAMPRTRKVTTVCNGKKEVWNDREEAQDFFLRQMMTAEGEERGRAECIYIQLIHGLDKCED
jgi:hypothetical protein